LTLQNIYNKPLSILIMPLMNTLLTSKFMEFQLDLLFKVHSKEQKFHVLLMVKQGQAKHLRWKEILQKEFQDCTF